MQLIKLVPSLVRLGEPLPWDVRDEHGKLLLANGHLIEDADHLTALLERGAYVNAEEARAVAKAAAAKAAAKRPDERQRPVSLFTIWERALWQLDRLLRRASEEPGFPARAEELARHIVTLTDRDADIAIYLAVRQDPKRLSIYGLAHAVHCALIGLLMARRIGWDADKALTLVKAALTMNIATLDLQGRLAVQGVPPTPGQSAVLAEHPAKGEQMLRAAGVEDEAWLQAVLQHHERPDGGGYPAGLREPTDLAQALRHVDVFMAKISPRTIRAPVPIQQAAREMFQQDPGQLSAAIVKELGIYPPGDFVKLKSGELAVVVRRGASASTPLAASITDRGGMPVVNTVIRDTAKPEFAILSAAADKSLVLRMAPERLYGLPE
ncbi:HD-GYP domain-containing protein [Piscinibacter sp.]|jgi:HD-GYP domain-containing protein (c-di-GMP phosphodiesterase class II)|uniref:HD-GYP domain-containing protein n=1 Tax=Piscinibacter sp. TaxID=1903157 RepID=UPI00355A79C8